MNRIIKYVLRKLSDRIRGEKILKTLSEEEINEEINQRMRERTSFMKEMRIPCSDFERYKTYKEIEQEVEQNETYRASVNALLQSNRELVNLLDDKWFSDIYDIPYLSEIRLTPKFASNSIYSVIYKIFTENYMDKPFFSASFDVNAFGIRPTQQIYEYWVFYKLLSALLKIGFKLDERGDLKEHFSHFTRKQQLKPLILKLYREDGSRRIDLEFGYNVTFKTDYAEEYKGPLQRTPDYYIRIISDNHSHWYFLDAKYKYFVEDFKNKNKICYMSEVFDVAVKKYIKDMTDIFVSNSLAEDIRGSYIIMANIENEGGKSISDTDHLFGKKRDIYDFIDHNKNNKLKYKYYSQAGLAALPRHRYGAIKLVPDYDQELTTLYQMIIEYLETDGNKGHPNFNWCWRCSSTNVNKQTLSTVGNNLKYYTTCSECGDFRVITNCEESKGKHLLVKHETGNYHKCGSTKWFFECPECE